jgi:GNAT superfamily N-acetyltransferase
LARLLLLCRWMRATTLRDYAEPVILRDGASLTLRALRPSDKPLLAQLFARLSPQTIHYRVFGQQGPLTDKQLAYLTELDFATHVGLAATVSAPDGVERIVGVGRYIRVDAHGALVATSPRAEVAFTVEDGYQGRGIGTLLLEHLAEIAHSTASSRSWPTSWPTTPGCWRSSPRAASS